MRLPEIGYEIRKVRRANGLTQAALASAAGLSRTTINQLENGGFPDLGVRKLQALLTALGLDLSLAAQPTHRAPDYVRLAATTASVSFKEPLTEDELVGALLRGKFPSGKRPHFRVLFEEANPKLVQGLLREVSRWTTPGRLERSLEKIGREIGAGERAKQWQTNG